MPALNQIAPRTDTAAGWASRNPILRAFEFTLESDTLIIKFGDEDGATAYNDTDAWTGTDIGALTASDITDFAAAVAAATVLKADLVGGTVPASQIPSIAITDFLGTVANQAGMLAVVGGAVGDWVIRSDTGTSWFITGTPTTDIASWTELAGGSVAGVTTVNSRTGAVTLTSADVGLGSVNNTADTAKPVSTAQAAANAAVVASSAQRASNLSDLANATTARTNLALGNVNNTSDANKPISTATQTALNGKLATGYVPTATATTYTPTSPRVATNVQAAIDEVAAGGAAAATWPVSGTPATFPPSAHSHTATEISNSTTVGRAVVTAVDAQAARSAIGAMASTFTGLQIGTTSTTAAAGNRVYTATQTTFAPTGALTATDVQNAIVQASQSGGGSGSSSTYVWQYASGAYPAIPASKPVGVLKVEAEGPVPPTTLPSWVGVAPGEATLWYSWAPRT